MASNLWRVEKHGNGRPMPYQSFTDKLGRTFSVYRARLDHQAGSRYLDCLRIKRLHEAVRRAGSQRKAAEILGISLGKLQRSLKIRAA